MPNETVSEEWFNDPSHQHLVIEHMEYYFCADCDRRFITFEEAGEELQIYCPYCGKSENVVKAESEE